jgi:hypothetical protein
MKRILITIISILLALSLLAGCASAGITRGTIEGNVYTNEPAELTFTAPDGWKYATDEEIAKMLRAGAESIDSNALSDENFKKVNIYDMFVIDNETRSAVQVMFQDLAAAGTYIDEEMLFSAMRDNMENITNRNYSFTRYEDATIGANTFKVMSIIDTDSNIPQYFYARLGDHYMICIIAIITPGSDIDSVMANFS